MLGLWPHDTLTSLISLHLEPWSQASPTCSADPTCGFVLSLRETSTHHLDTQAVQKAGSGLCWRAGSRKNGTAHGYHLHSIQAYPSHTRCPSSMVWQAHFQRYMRMKDIRLRSTLQNHTTDIQGACHRPYNPGHRLCSPHPRSRCWLADCQIHSSYGMEQWHHLGNVFLCRVLLRRSGTRCERHPEIMFWLARWKQHGQVAMQRSPKHVTACWPLLFNQKTPRT